jgi:hypothetical protein
MFTGFFDGLLTDLRRRIAAAIVGGVEDAATELNARRQLVIDAPRVQLPEPEAEGNGTGRKKVAR